MQEAGAMSRTWDEPSGGRSRGTLRRVGRALVEGVKRWSADHCGMMAAALAFYAAFSLAPMLLIVIAVAGAVFGPEAVQGRLFEEIQGLVGRDGAIAIQTMLANAWEADSTLRTTLLSIVAICVGASATFAQLNLSLNVIWRAHPSVRKHSALFDLVRVRLMSFGLVVGVGFLVIVLLVLDASLTYATQMLWNHGETMQGITQMLQRCAALLVLFAAFAVLLKILPDAETEWSDVLLGAGAAALLFAGGKQLFALYLARAGTADAFGAAGSLAVILMWLYYSSAVFLVGAEIASVWTEDRRRPAIT